MTSCPSNAQLAALLDERLEAETLAVVAAHLEDCLNCQQTLETLTAARFSSPDWSEARDVGVAEVAAPFPDAEGGAGPLGTLLFDSPLQVEQDSRRKRLILDRSVRQPSSLHCLPADQIEAADGSSPASGWPPEVAGYDIVGRLGRGGMGVVYRARQHGLDRLVALKMLRGGGHADPESLARFRIEVRSVARLRHPNVVQVFDVGESRGLPFVALELLEGGSLDARNGGNPQPEADSAGLVATLARAVASAHGEGIVHRDLKPSNVLFTRDGIPKITDFGLAKRLDEDDGQTQSGQVMGSPSFMAPEQARGAGRAIGIAADIYSLGAILYEMLTGRPPFKGSSPLETLHQVVHSDPVLPSRLRPGLASDLETICIKCLSKEPAQRYETADHLADDLDRFLAGTPIHARRIHAVERAWKWARREPTAASLVLAVGLFGLLGVAGGIRAVNLAAERTNRSNWATRGLDEATTAFQHQDWKAGRDVLNRSLRLLEDQPALVDLRRRTEALLSAIEQAEATQRNLQEFWPAAHLAQLADAEWTWTDGTTGGDPRPVRQAVETALAFVGQSEQPGPAGGLARWRAFPPPSWLPAEQCSALNRAIHDLILLRAEAAGRPAPGEDRLVQAHRALAILDDVPGSTTPTRAVLDLQSRLQADLGETAAAETLRQQAARTQPVDARDQIALGRECSLRGDWPAAIAALEAALQLDPTQFAAQLDLALAELRSGRPQAARPYLTVCLQQEPRAVGLYLLRGLALGQAAGQHWQTARTQKDKAARLEAERLFRDAEADFQKALDLRPGEPRRAVLLANRGMVRFLARRYPEAEADLATAVGLAPDRLEARVNWAQVLRRLGRTDDAVAQLTQCLDLEPTRAALYRERALARLDHPAHSASGTTDQAIDDLTQAIRLSAADSVDQAENFAQRARVRHQTGQMRAALADAEETLRIVPAHADAALIRLQTLLDLKQYADVVRGCDAALVRRPGAAELWELRGLARSFRQDFAGAVADFTHALNLDPTRQSARVQRGWAYFLSDAAKLALVDFNAVLDGQPDHGEALGCRGFALASTGNYLPAIADAEASLRLADAGNPRTYYNAARIYARAATGLTTGPASRRPADAIALAERYQNRALSLIQTTVDHLPTHRRGAFCRDVIQTDPALSSLRPRLPLARVDGSPGQAPQ